MTIPKPVIAVLLFATLCATACKKNSHETAPEDATLYVYYGGGYTETGYAPDKLQITANASYVLSYNSNGQLITKKLSDAIQDSLKPYLASFPRAAIKADPNVPTYSLRGATDGPFEGFIYVQKNPADTTEIYLDTMREKPGYIQAFRQRINQTIINNKIFN